MKILSVTTKVNLIIITSLVIGLGTISYFFARSLASTIDTSTEDNLSRQSEILFTSIENVMIPGDAPIAVDFFNDIQTINPDYTIQLYRRNGVPAFSDDSTIRQVNKNLGEQIFEFRSRITKNKSEPIEPHFSEATGSPPMPAFYRVTKNEAVFFNVYKPLINLPKCTGCHGSDHTVRGVIDIQSNISNAVKKQRSSFITASVLFLGMVALLTTILTQFMRTTVITPVKRIRDVCAAVTKGNFEQQVSVKNTDEIGELGNTVNTMVEGLYERFQLSKYVSSSTLQSIKGSERGQAIPVTMFFSDIRGFTSFSETNPPETVVDHLNAILNVQTEILIKYGGDIDKYVGDEIVAFFSEEYSERNACMAAVEIQKVLKSNSATDYGNLSVGIGINSGDVILGMIGSQRRADFTVIGDNVNIASRLCDAAKSHQIIISDSTYQKSRDHFIVEGPYRLKAKGKNINLRVYILQGIT